MNWKVVLATALVGTMLTASEAGAVMRITEWMYNNTPEFVEFTNVGATPVDMTGWGFDDNDPAQGKSSLSAFGTVAPYESVLITEASDTAFRTRWGLAGTVKVIGGITNNLGRADTINLYDSASALIDTLKYDDQNGLGLRTQDVSGNPKTLAALGTNSPNDWKLAVVGDEYGSYASTPAGQVANPGKFLLVPEPASALLLLLGVVGVAARRRRS